MVIQVEVCVQDGVSQSDDIGVMKGSGAAWESAIAPIPSETWQTWFEQWLTLLNPQISPIQAYELSLRLTSDREIQALNAQYRHQDKPTDVLAFAALEADCPPVDDLQLSLPIYLGDIIISVETAERQAESQGHSWDVELAWLASHGLLHLLGWDHPDEESLRLMLAQQKDLLHTVGLSMVGS